MSQNNENNIIWSILGAAFLFFMLPIFYIVNHTGADTEIVAEAFISTVILIVMFGILFNIKYAIFGSPVSSLSFLALNWLLWVDVFRSAAQNQNTNPYPFDKITQQLPWWSESWFLWGVEVILIGAIAYYLWRDRDTKRFY